MRCYGLTFPPTDNRFCVPNATPLTLRPTKSINYPTRVAVGFGSLKAKATLNDGNVVAQANFYELLRIPLSGSLTEIKQAYKQMARKYHPDVSPPGRVEEYTKRFIKVQEAYETLSDPIRRAMYDRDMARGIHLTFNARTRYHDDDLVIEQKMKWKSRWESQLSELKRRSESKDVGGNMSWAARMRQQKNESSNEL